MNLHLKQRVLRFISTTFVSFKGFPYLPRWIVFLMDLSISVLAFSVSYFVCSQLLQAEVLMKPFLLKLSFNTVVTVFFFYVFKTYAGIIRYSSFVDGLRIFSALFCVNLLMLAISNFTSLFAGKAILLNAGFFASFFLSFSLMFLFRMFVKVIYDQIKKEDNSDTHKQIPLLIFDVTPSTVSIAKMIKDQSASQFEFVGFISPNVKIIEKSIANEPIFSMSKKDAQKIRSKGVKAVLINSIETGRREKQTIAEYCIDNGIKMLSPPPVSDWINGEPIVNKIKNIQIEDLLGRVPIKISVDKIAENLKQNCIMVTGAAGSIGSEIVRQIAQFNPDLLLLCDISETPLHHLQLEIEGKFPKLKFIPIICDIRNYDRMEHIFKTYRPNHVYHAAAYKHVPLMEIQPSEAVYTNVFGTKFIAELAVKYDVDVFVMISTDKAVNPTNVMGASKRIAEIYVQSLFDHLESNGDIKNVKTKIITTRFGNVLGSSGSVIPLFKEQIEKGGPVTVTHPEITRFFMTIPEACRLVLEAGNMGKGGEIFVFDMGSPIKIADLAKKMIHLAGFIPNKDINITFVGLRQGEKLYEELLTNEESTQPTHNPKIMIGSTRKYDYLVVNEKLDDLFSYVSNYNDKEVVKVMKEIVPEFISANSPYSAFDK